MFPVLETLVKLFKWLVEAAVEYARTDEGGAGLQEIADELEAEGIDIPFYEPSEQGEPLTMNSNPDDPRAAAQQAAAFRAKHPELFNKRGVQS